MAIASSSVLPASTAQHTISVVGTTPTALFAASELAKYLRLLSPRPYPVAIEVVATADAAAPGLTLRLLDANDPLAQGLDADLDDAICIDVHHGRGAIAGLNPRSLLLGVYRFLFAAGCRWVRPGAEGEYIPRRDPATLDVTMEERPSFRHRCICIEGAVSLEDVLAIVDWAPKVGYSAYFMQFTSGFTFFDRWYSHLGTSADREPFSEATARAWTIRVEQEIARRSLVYHAVGHGWTCLALGLELSHWNPTTVPDLAAITPMLAEVQGRRALQWDRPMITSLCFSQEKVRSRMVAAVVEHALHHPEIGLLHVWIDDGGNNKCECANCRNVLPSELYVNLLRELDAALTARGCPVRIVFLGYSDLLWAPGADAPPLDPKRFVFMYANGRSPYTTALKPVPPAAATIPPFVLNKSRLKRDMAEFQGFLQCWQNYFSGDSFVYEYHPMGSLLINQHALALIINEDVHQLRALGLNGWVSCQSQRTAFPSGICAYMLGRTLWDAQLDGEMVLDEFFVAACGQDSALAKEFLKVAAEELEKAGNFTGTAPRATAATVKKHLAKLAALCADFAKIVERNLGETDPCRARSWDYLRWYLRVLDHLRAVIAAKSENGDVIAAWAAAKDFIIAHEARYRADFDSWAFVTQMENFLSKSRLGDAPEEVVKRD
jgi:hypothetical protein